MPRRRTNRSAPRPADLDALVLTRQVTAWLRICTRTGPAYQWAASSLLAAFPAIGREYLKMVEQAEQVPAGPSSVPLTVHLPQPLPTPHSPLPTPHSPLPDDQQCAPRGVHCASPPDNHTLHSD